MVLHCGTTELSADDGGNPITMARKVPDLNVPGSIADWKSIVHRDIKPANIFLRARNIRHPHAPVCVFADFENAFFPSDVAQNRVSLEALRGGGTKGHYPPESFAEAWDFADWDTSFVGKWSEKSNIWQIATIMYALMLLNAYDYPTPSRPFIPPNIGGAPPKGNSYGWQLSQTQDRYSEELVHLVWEMLYEVPAHRPGLAELKTRVEQGFRSAQEACVLNVGSSSPFRRSRRAIANRALEPAIA